MTARSVPYDAQPKRGRDTPDHAEVRRRLQADLEAFRAQGGRIEVLPITRPRDRKDEADPARPAHGQPAIDGPHVDG